MKKEDFRALLDFLRETYAVSDLDGFVGHILENLPKLVRSEATVYNEYSFKRNRIVWQQNPAIAFPGSERVWERYSGEHPILNHIRRTKDDRAVKFSDFVSQRQFRRTHLYNEFFRPLDINHQMHVLFSEPQTVLVGIALNRKSGDFSERDRDILNLLRPHFLRAYQNAAAITEILQEMTALRRAIEELNRGVIFLTGNRKIKSMNETARSWINEYFGSYEARGDRLPKELELWVMRQQRLLESTDRIPPARGPFAVERNGKRLRAWLISMARETLLLMEERRTSVDPLSLRSLGLTRRESEVLAWMAYGKTNAEIGAILQARPRTVEKHIERILDKLGVGTRTGAVALALQSLETLPG